MDLIGNLFSYQTKKPIVNDISQVIESRRNQIELLVRNTEKEKDFSESVIALVDHEAPEFSREIRKVMTPFERTFKLQSRYTKMQTRSVEDLNDTIERFSVLVRVNQNYENAKEDLNTISTKLANAKAELKAKKDRGVTDTYRLEENIVALSNKMKKAIDDLKACIVEYIKEKERFNKFRSRRMKQCFKGFGIATRDYYDEVSLCYKEFDSAISESLKTVDTILPSTQ